MSRLTITLSEPRYRALKEAAARRGKAIGQLIDESLEFYGIKTREDALAIFERAGQASRLHETDAMELAVSEVRAHREGQ
ncbi:MAG: CopG family transcriptional regulator [Ottowia sp.]|uniref:CopG family transcriptional regulator n=1 Tax=Ottowia sp. TaxID=1898956 RepID=UPI0039E61171